MVWLINLILLFLLVTEQGCNFDCDTPWKYFQFSARFPTLSNDPKGTQFLICNEDAYLIKFPSYHTVRIPIIFKNIHNTSKVDLNIFVHALKLCIICLPKSSKHAHIHAFITITFVSCLVIKCLGSWCIINKKGIDSLNEINPISLRHNNCSCIFFQTLHFMGDEIDKTLNSSAFSTCYMQETRSTLFFQDRLSVTLCI